jgi:RNA polymerase sigma factor (sigma-70 family)
MDVNRLLCTYDSLIRATALKYSKHFTIARHVESTDDIVNEARIAAWKAILSYKTTQGTKIETYITSCIKNRMIDLNRKAHRASRPDLCFLGEPELAHATDLQATEDLSEELIDAVTLKSILTPKEFHVLAHLKTGGGMGELITEYRSTRARSSVEARGEVVKCLHRIRRKLQLRGLSLSV